MRQALHIVKKDVGYLWKEIGLFLAMAVMFAWWETHSQNTWWVESLLIISAVYLIARLVHAEAIPGHNQFWLTRPYRWQSLLYAKLLFILTFVSLPTLIAEIVIRTSGGFPLKLILTGLLWSQFLLALGLWIPAASLAAMTRNNISFVPALLILLAAASAAQDRFGMAVMPSWPNPVRWPSPLEWIRESIALTALAALAVSLLFIQYRKRWTVFSRITGAAILVLGAMAFWFLPWSPALAVQGALSKQAVDASMFSVKLDPASQRLYWPADSKDKVAVVFPLLVSGIPHDAEVRADAVAFTISGADGEKAGPRYYQSKDLERSSAKNGATVFYGDIAVDSALLKGPFLVRVHASLYLTMFGNAHSKTIRASETPQDAIDGLQCYLVPPEVRNRFVSDSGALRCRSASRWPSRLVYATVGPEPKVFTELISYSPFPAEIGLNTTVVHSVNAPPKESPEVTIISREPIAHFRRDVDFAGVRLREFCSPEALAKLE